MPYAYIGMLDNVPQVYGALSEAVILLAASNTAASHLTGALANEKAIWALISCYIFLGIWKADACFRKTREDPSYLLIPG